MSWLLIASDSELELGWHLVDEPPAVHLPAHLSELARKNLIHSNPRDLEN